ncbi:MULTISPECIES: SDR family NAD(P)-dependent oxidoreductase [unclassified Nocardioides]|uniref:SDR family NAD(P)-dependent oxidoreductase n=1 Tax=unclassified Nocardioides TaxID=2615069 RepID=UPI0009F01459|nr:MULTISPECIES: SDR family NAD(P)-dependent oxidoreductase [unclassified Nocardioides]GAW47885.1 Short-chain dehydrogenase/reductase SDR [Nocardioides sp. PD653-B2]GAW53812.1 Short-chain dehydrogenase/reductase SDR [Nocardioides sp. PD653]
MDIRFTNSRVLVTGGGKGIGAAVAEAFAEAGATVGVHYHQGREDADQLVERLTARGLAAFSLGADLTADEAPSNLVKDFVKLAGGVDVLINNAGGLIRRSPVEDTDDALFRDVVQLNFGSAFAMTRAVIPYLRANGGGSIVNISSVAARTGGAGNAVVYAASKGALTTFSRGVAKEVVADGIRVNSVEPGLIDTAFHANTTPSAFQTMASGVPMGRAGRPADLTGAVLFLASDVHAGYITGQSIGVNGGLWVD